MAYVAVNPAFSGVHFSSGRVFCSYSEWYVPDESVVSPEVLGIGSTTRPLSQTSQIELEALFSKVQPEQLHVWSSRSLDSRGIDDSGKGRGLKPSSGHGERQTVQNNPTLSYNKLWHFGHLRTSELCLAISGNSSSVKSGYSLRFEGDTGFVVSFAWSATPSAGSEPQAEQILFFHEFVKVHRRHVHSFSWSEFGEVEVDPISFSEPQWLHSTTDWGFLEAQALQIQLSANFFRFIPQAWQVEFFPGFIRVHCSHGQCSAVDSFTPIVSIGALNVHQIKVNHINIFSTDISNIPYKRSFLNVLR